MENSHGQVCVSLEAAASDISCPRIPTNVRVGCRYAGHDIALELHSDWHGHEDRSCDFYIWDAEYRLKRQATGNDFLTMDVS